MGVTQSLNEAHQGFLPANCITQLLTTRAFAKHSVPIQDWISAQIMECSTPLHPVIPELITAYAASCFQTSECQSSTLPLSEKFFIVGGFLLIKYR
ncbi:unnamed protein product [Dracunculus medinensis]|uniref:Uncharacterized protein n=1 Tax=Dracunculus medinensis TaxID=318479 RepID=A0A0N4UJ75_DRAME|nr:unnamed protein product [Dracunculus medinensis]